MEIRRKLVGGIGAATLFMGVLGGAVAVNAAPASPAATVPITAVASAMGVETRDANETPIDASRAKVGVDAAKAAALAKLPGGTVKGAQLEDENGTLVWAVAVTDASGKMQDVKVDATSGQVVRIEADGPEGPETPDGETAD